MSFSDLCKENTDPWLRNSYTEFFSVFYFVNIFLRFSTLSRGSVFNVCSDFCMISDTVPYGQKYASDSALTCQMHLFACVKQINSMLDHNGIRRKRVLIENQPKHLIYSREFGTDLLEILHIGNSFWMVSKLSSAPTFYMGKDWVVPNRFISWCPWMTQIYTKSLGAEIKITKVKKKVNNIYRNLQL